MEIQKYIDHTLLKPEATEEQVIKICKEAKEYGFASVCVNPYYASLVKAQLQGSTVKTCIVVGFPLGASSTAVKGFEAEDAIKNGAEEVDMVINIGALKNKKYHIVLDDIRAVVEKSKGQALVKVIIETCLLTKEEIIQACKLAVQADADFVKTSTGFSTGGATVEDVALMRKTVGISIGVKASGGIRNLESTKSMILAGASRIGASAGIAIVEESLKR